MTDAYVRTVAVRAMQRSGTLRQFPKRPYRYWVGTESEGHAASGRPALLVLPPLGVDIDALQAALDTFLREPRP